MGIPKPELTAIYCRRSAKGDRQQVTVNRQKRLALGVDKSLSADGELLRLHDDYRAAGLPPHPLTFPTVSVSDYAAMTAAHGTVTSIAITWGDGRVTKIYPPP